MPRVEFSKVEDFNIWLKDHFTPEKYHFYLTSEDEIILVPRRSTQPLTYAYFKSSELEIKEVLEQLKPLHGVQRYKCKSFSWRVDLPPGVRIPLIEE